MFIKLSRNGYSSEVDRKAVARVAVDTTVVGVQNGDSSNHRAINDEVDQRNIIISHDI